MKNTIELLLGFASQPQEFKENRIFRGYLYLISSDFLIITYFKELEHELPLE